MKNILSYNFNEHINVTKKTKKQLSKKIIEASKLIFQTIKKNGGKIIWCGNGGSSADSLHLSSEFVGKFKKKRKALPSICISSDIANLTCIANDYGYENIFSRQLSALGKSNDLLMCLSTSGNSKNIIKCLKLAKKLSIRSILLSGRNGGEARKYSDLNLLVPSKTTARIQEMHLMIGQILCELVEKQFRFNE